MEWPALVAGPVILCFELEGKPQHKARHRSRIGYKDGKPFVMMYPEPETAAAEKVLAEIAALHMRGRAPTDKPVALLVHVYRPIAESWSKTDKAKALANALLPTSKPDGDNYLKFVQDSLNKICFLDDSQVVDARVIKLYSDDPGIRIEVREFIDPVRVVPDILA